MDTSTDFDEDALAKAYDAALAHEKAGRLDAAAEAYRQALLIDPADHAGAAVRLAAIGRGDVPARAPDAYVMTLFDQHADVFETVLVDHLGYAVPAMLRRRLDALGLGPFARALDLGCGTGLTGEALRDICDHLTGVDLSERMIEIADEKEVFDRLLVGEAVRALETLDGETFDLLAATDVLPYLGRLEPLFSAAAARLRPGGLFAFSTETLPQAAMAGRDVTVGPHHRFAHAGSYVMAALSGAGLAAVEAEPITVRREENVPISGQLVIARRLAGKDEPAG